jgi:mycofactocin precursor
MPNQSDYTSAVDEPRDQPGDELIEGMLMVEELTIDGMCGAY